MAVLAKLRKTAKSPSIGILAANRKGSRRRPGLQKVAGRNLRSVLVLSKEDRFSAWASRLAGRVLAGCIGTVSKRNARQGIPIEGGRGVPDREYPAACAGRKIA